MIDNILIKGQQVEFNLLACLFLMFQY